jgi:hypothetical protein
MKNAMILTSLLVVLLLISCKKDNKEDCCVNIDNYTDIKITDISGNDLINPKTSGSLNTSHTNLYSLVNGQKAHLTYNIWQVPEQPAHEYSGKYIIRIFPNESNATIMIKWNENDTDTLQTQIKKTGSTVFCEKVWYNGVVKYDVTSHPAIVDSSFSSRFFQVTK